MANKARIIAMATNKNTPAEVPVIPESELKLPEEQFGGTPAAAPANRFFTILLIGLLLLFLGLLLSVIIWGQQLVDFFMPQSGTDMSTEETPALSEEAAALQTISEELQTMAVPEVETGLAAIEADMAADLTASSTATE